MRYRVPSEDLQERMKSDLYREGSKLFWRKPPKNHCKKRNNLAGYTKPEGYVVVNINKQCWYAHRIVWLLEYGYWPVFQLDHKDGNKANNSPDNLREVTQQQNSTSHRRTSKEVTSKYRGVSFNTRLSKWVASLTYKKESYYLGVFSSEKEAALAFNAKAYELGFNKEALNAMHEENL